MIPAPAAERVIHALSAVSSILLVDLGDGRYECRKCLLLALDCTQAAFLVDRRAALEHLDAHARRDAGQAGGSGAKDAIWKLETCSGPCRGSGLIPQTRAHCQVCEGTGKNALGRERGVRRGVVVA